MRDPKRIDEVMNELTEIWKANPDWRFGQSRKNRSRISSRWHFAYILDCPMFYFAV